LDGKPIPDALPWLADNPMIYHSSRLGLITSVLFWLVLLAVFYFMLYEWKNRQLGLKQAQSQKVESRTVNKFTPDKTA
jgi:hypothetical protein